ncbi:hypothetical protein K440DRAFT_43698 [Wilcoxina mikolae CBS 423.85]|nr:hypothetical protein K440DRAFT_43698 [Wilcoxina mikolae CBS 423.85]
MADDQSKLDFLKKFEELFDSKTHSDLTIAVGNTKFHAHQNILKLRTSFFEKATSEESGFAEAKDKTVTIEDHSTHAVWRVLRYCYTADYSDDSNNLALGEEDDLGALKHCRVHALADMLEIPALKTIAATKLDTKLANHWVTADFPGVVKEVYSTTNTRDHEVRDVIIRATRTHLNELLAIQEFKDVMFEFGEFSGGLVVDGQLSKCFTCSSNSSQMYCVTCAPRTSKCVTCATPVSLVHCSTHRNRCPSGSCACVQQVYCNSCAHYH